MKRPNLIYTNGSSYIVYKDLLLAIHIQRHLKNSSYDERIKDKMYCACVRIVQRKNSPFCEKISDEQVAAIFYDEQTYYIKLPS